MKQLFMTSAVLACISLLFAGSASGVGLVFFGEDLGQGENSPLSSWPNASSAEADFLSYLVGVGTEDFEDFSDGDGAPLALSFPGAGDATLNGSGEIEDYLGNGRYPISGDNFWEVSGAFSIAFDSPVAAFGFYGIDIGDFNGQVTLALANGGSVDLTINHTMNGAGGSVLFYGYIDEDNPWTSATFGNTAGGVDYFGFDDMTIGSVEQVVPPTVYDGGFTAGLLAMAFAGLPFLRRRKV